MGVFLLYLNYLTFSLMDGKRGAMMAIPRDSDTLKVGRWSVEPLANQMTFDGQQVVLRAQVMGLLVYLASRGGLVTSLEAIHDELWQGRVVSSGTIYNCIAELRQAFAALHPTGKYIETIPKKGYRLVAPVDYPEAQSGKQLNRSIVVAILPLRNRSGADDEYLCAGISEEVLHSLSKVPALKVVSALSLKGLDLNNQEVGRRFEADSVLAGSLQRSGTKLRLSFRLEDVTSGQVLWSEHSDQPFSDIFEVQENVARQVVEAFVSHPDVARSPDAVPGDSGTMDAQALNDFLLGSHSLSLGTAEEYDATIAHFERAVGRDPCFARAYYRLYLACYFRTRYHVAGPEIIDRARIAAARAQELGYRPAVPWIHIYRRLHKDARIGTVEMGLEAANKFRSRDPEWRSFAYEQMSWVLSASGLFKAALEFARHALDSPSLNFQDSDVDEELHNWEAGAGNFQEAIQKLSSLIQRDPRRVWFRHERSTLYCRIGDFPKAEEEIAALEGLGARSRNTRIVYAYWRGDRDTVQKLLPELKSMGESRPMFECINHAMIGDMDRAADLFCQATDASSDVAFVDLGFMRAQARYSLPQSLVTELESQPLFQALLEQEGIDDPWRHRIKSELNSISDLTGVLVKYDNEH